MEVVREARRYAEKKKRYLNVIVLSFFSQEEGPEGRKVMVVKYFVQLLAHWMELFPYDFRDDNGMMMSNVRAITQKCVAIDPNVIDTTVLIHCRHNHSPRNSCRWVAHVGESGLTEVNVVFLFPCGS